MDVAILKANLKAKGGLEKYTRRLASEWIKRGANVSILTQDLPGAFLSHPANIQPFSVCRWPAYRRLEQFDRQVHAWPKTHPADIVFGMERNRIQTHLRAGNGVHAAYLSSRIRSDGWFKYRMCRINPLHRKILELEKAAFQYPGLRVLFVNSHMVKNEVLEHYEVSPEQIAVVHNGVEWESMRSDFQRWEQGKQEALHAWNLDPDDVHLVFIGNGYRRKGLDLILEALAMESKKKWHLCVVGKDKELRQYQSKAIRMGLARKVRFFGAQDNIVPFYQLADALVIPSFYDPFANVTLEALAMGVFVVSSKTNGGHEILTKYNGAVIELPLNAESLADSLQRVLRKTTQGAFAIRSSVSQFDFSIQLPKLVARCV